eukprot:CAMPEP_0173116268 /NCGR_PEP_ID=MMETSP1102-20130122/49205_1 /TAXON_ID=49646 /ORGANISM="Geminigera sp., Strain Caron Lab Isolate" /LENGTH=68 /DNA_ID=CAMNT_0014019883 /DNA_START=84 /DNA_END=287 /DNA_ORIENTATION=+
MTSGTRGMQTGCAAFWRGLGTDAICFLDHALQHRVHLLAVWHSGLRRGGQGKKMDVEIIIEYEGCRKQ